jgi:ATP-dependent helicase/nuclease subunit B
VATRRLLASGSLGSVCDRGIGVAAVSFVTVYRLAELLGSAQLAGSGRRPVSTPVIAAALRSALTREPGIFAPVAGHAATETALVAAYRELRDLSDGALDALARSSDRAADVVRLHQAARASLAPEFYDEEDLLDSAADALRKRRGCRWPSGHCHRLPAGAAVPPWWRAARCRGRRERGDRAGGDHR